MQRPRVKVDGQPVTLTWTPPADVEHPEFHQPRCHDRGISARLWCMWAYWTVRGATGFTWRKHHCQPCPVSMTREEALAYLRQRGPDGTPVGLVELRNLERRGLL